MGNRRYKQKLKPIVYFANVRSLKWDSTCETWNMRLRKDGAIGVDIVNVGCNWRSGYGCNIGVMADAVNSRHQDSFATKVWEGGFFKANAKNMLCLQHVNAWSKICQQIKINVKQTWTSTCTVQSIGISLDDTEFWCGQLITATIWFMSCPNDCAERIWFLLRLSWDSVMSLS